MCMISEHSTAFSISGPTARRLFAPPTGRVRSGETFGEVKIAPLRSYSQLFLPHFFSSENCILREIVLKRWGGANCSHGTLGTIVVKLRRRIFSTSVLRIFKIKPPWKRHVTISHCCVNHTKYIQKRCIVSKKRQLADIKRKISRIQRRFQDKVQCNARAQWPSGSVRPETGLTPAGSYQRL